MSNAATDKHWTFDRRVSMGHIVTTVVAIGAIVGTWTTMQTRLSVAETKLSSLEERQARDSEKVDHQLEKINEKLDRLIERELGR